MEESGHGLASGSTPETAWKERGKTQNFGQVSRSPKRDLKAGHSEDCYTFGRCVQLRVQ
jgi:hypothetical protein